MTTRTIVTQLGRRKQDDADEFAPSLLRCRGKRKAEEEAAAAAAAAKVASPLPWEESPAGET